VAKLVYSRLKLDYQGREGAVVIGNELGLGAERVLVRSSGRSMSEPVTALYTPAAFETIAGLGSVALVAQFADDSWVLGDDLFSVGDSPRLIGEVMDLYEDDYIATWDGVLRDFTTVSFGSVSDLTAGLAILAGPSSPLRALYQLIDRNTYLVKSAEDQAREAGVVDRAQQAVASRLDRLLNTAETAAGAPQQAQRGAKVTAHFADIHRLVGTPEGQARFDRVLAQLNDLQRGLQSVGTGVGEINPLDAMAQAGSGDAARTLRQEAATLPPMLAGLVNQVTGRSTQVAMGQARNELLNLYRAEVVARCNDIVRGKYPFTRTSAADVPLDDFGRLFATSGVYASFYQQYVHAFVDKTRNPWRWRSGDGGSLGLSDAILRQFELVEQIRETYFPPGGTTPEVRFVLVTETHLSSGLRRARLEIDGQSAENFNGPERRLAWRWPGPNPGEAAVSFEAAGGDRPNIVQRGPWAMFRLLDQATTERQADSKYRVSWSTGGHTTTVMIEASSVTNPFAGDLLSRFSCGS
jgi:type VI secretion system protein ImpL